MLKTEQEQYLVHKIRQRHIWLEVINGLDTGMRLSVPRRHQTYSDETTEIVKSFNEGEVYTMTLVSDTEHPPQWRIDSIKFSTPDAIYLQTD